MESNWGRIVEEVNRGASRKALWGLLRQFGQPDGSWLSQAGWLWKTGQEHESADGKALKLRLISAAYKDSCETVLLRPRGSRFAVCVSTQIGCGVGCRFCATGKMGFQRNLSTWEILEQFLRAGWAAAKCFQPSSGRLPPLRNVVFMGMGEPLHNAEAVEHAIELLADPQWFGLSMRSITLSTAGVPAKMISMASRFPRLRIALSLHSADPQKRRFLVPRGVADLEVLRDAIRQINSIQNDTVWIEIALIDGVNESPEDASMLIDFCRDLSVEVNVIPYNDTSHASLGSGVNAAGGMMRAPTPERVDAFIAQIRKAGIFTTHRKTLGESIQAACGQLITPGVKPEHSSKA